MSNITDMKSVLTQKGLEICCHKFHIPEDVHPQLPSPNQTIHEMPAGKIGVYTRFSKYANFRLPLSTFLVNVLRHYRINLSQLSVIAAAKVSYFEILCRVHSIEPTVGLFRCFYINSKKKGWMSFSKRWIVTPDPFPKSTEFNADDYVVFVAHLASYQKFLEPFLCLVGMSHYYTLDEDTYPNFLHDDRTDMDLFAFIQVTDPTKVKVIKRERVEGEVKLLDSTVRRVVSLQSVAPTHAESELEASVDRLFDEGGSTEHEDSTAGGGHDAGISLVTVAKDVVVVTAKRPRRQCKKRQAVTDASELLASSIMNVEVGVEVVTTLPLVTSLVSTTSGREGGNPIDSITRLNLQTIGASERFIDSSDSSHHSSTHASGAEVDFVIRSVVLPLVMTEAMVTSHAVNAPSVSVLETGTKTNSPVHASMFHDSDSTKTVKADVAVPFYSAKQDLSMGSRELMPRLSTKFLFRNEMYYHHLFTEFVVGAARQACLNEEVIMRTGYCLSERKRLESECESQADLLKAKDVEIDNLKAQLLLKEAEATEAIRLCVQVSAAEAADKVHTGEMDALKQNNVVLENKRDSLNGKIIELQSSVSAKDLKLKEVNVVMSSLNSQNDGLIDQVSGYERLKEQIKEFQDAQMNIVNDKVAKLDADLLEMTLHLEEKFYPHLLTTIFDRSRAIEKGIQSGLSAGIDHEKAGRNLDDVVTYNPVAEADYNFALRRFREVDFHLLSELSSHKDARVADIMDLSSGDVLVTIATTTALSTTFASASFVPPITIEYYEITCTNVQDDAQGNIQGNVAFFPAVEFEKEELDTTPERDPPS
uniref:Transposase (putative) gypsy type domain-containing protein n=1 Tax=Tanacetum cinerariifolium TaxID=118510 RepID=A0A6L2L9U0_TANCI|nr:hypothetical protein [Tanacetum cinerariifolium]